MGLSCDNAEKSPHPTDGSTIGSPNGGIVSSSRDIQLFSGCDERVQPPLHHYKWNSVFKIIFATTR
jgi:hypothetical protein